MSCPVPSFSSLQFYTYSYFYFLHCPLPLQPALSLYISWLTSVCVSRRNIFNWISNFILTWNSIYKRSRKEKENGTFLLDTRENIFSKFEFKVKFVASLPESDSWWCPGSRHLLSHPAPAPPPPQLKFIAPPFYLNLTVRGSGARLILCLYLFGISI